MAPKRRVLFHTSICNYNFEYDRVSPEMDIYIESIVLLHILIGARGKIWL